MAKTFEIGKVVATRRVWDLMDESQQFHDFASGCLSRYILYDWGDTCPEDWRANNEAALHGEMVMAVYSIPEDMESEFEEHLWIQHPGRHGERIRGTSLDHYREGSFRNDVAVPE